jgi:hypothetical protein
MNLSEEEIRQLVAIRNRNEERKKYSAKLNCYDCEKLPSDPLAEADIDALLVIIEPNPLLLAKSNETNQILHSDTIAQGKGSEIT